MQSYTHSLQRTCQVTAVGTNQTFNVGAVRKGDLILATALRRNVPADAASDSTWQFALTSAGLVVGATIDTEGVAASVAPSTVTLYRVLADDTLELRYVQGAADGVTAPQARANALVIRNRGDL